VIVEIGADGCRSVIRLVQNNEGAGGIEAEAFDGCFWDFGFCQDAFDTIAARVPDVI
jgi:hypothetical protein